ncbi:alpha/beta hydrolase [Paenibacillus pasadenensis]|uniref:alpha/beta hydrolase n=1 Tax=Paenibacillus pasadenensis TaxID=217090 RepID=UPI00203E9A1E|nr:alpha/beta fold hydrolase [Paenibacillus pasadenensis]MCM3748433.1 alpha/beta hydrolase [Paenibacillus pasadenensis]
MSSSTLRTPLQLEAPLAAVVPRRDTRRNALAAAVSATTALVLLLVVAFHGYIAWMVAYPYVAPVTSNPMEAKGLAYEDVTFPSLSGRTTVSGWYIPAAPGRSLKSESDRTIVLSHGYGTNREETWVPMYDLASLLHKLNYNVLMFDYGYASKQYRAPATGGWEESQQLLAAVDYVRTQGSKEVVVWGFSMGAGTALQAALQTDRIDAMILDSTFVPSPDTLFENVRNILDLPRFPSLPLIEKLLPLWTGVDFNKIPAEKVMNTSYSIPIYMIHGTMDAKASYQSAESIYEKQANPLSREWIVNGGQHELLFQQHPKEYIQRAALFLSQVNQSIELKEKGLSA